jgi:cell fate regulator YaaT (PSP1 superfamily)
MAKEQGLSLNSSKISGACGRLMCCLRFEHETYFEELQKTPSVDSVVITPAGKGTVIESKPLLAMVKVRLIDNPDAAPQVFSREDVKVISEGTSRSQD